MAGAGYKLFNTGDVLTAAQVNTYLMEQTVMVFDDAAARTTALSGVVSEGMISYLKDTNAVEVYNGSAWVASDDPNAIQNTIVDAKGDLIAASAADTPARLAVGNDGESIVADSSASTGLRWQSADNSNVIINGGFDIWQRGTGSLVPTGSNYLNADRFYLTGSSGAVTFTRQTDVPTSKYFQYSMGMSTTAGNGASFAQRIEAANSVGLAGKTVTFSVYAKGISGSTNLFVNFYYPTAKDNYAGVTQIGSSNELSSNPSGSWTRYSVTVTLPADVQNGLLVLLGRGTGACDTYITGMKLEIGSVATEFTRAGGTLAGELLAAQRYYYTTGTGNTTNNITGSFGFAGTTSRADFIIPIGTMRVKPSSITTTNVQVYNQTTAGGPYSGGTWALNDATTNFARVLYTHTTTLANAAGNIMIITLSADNGLIAFSAEL